MVPASDIGKLSFTPAANANGNGYAAFNFTVVDNTDLVSTSKAITFNVTAVNDAPTTANKAITFNEDTTYTLSPTDF